ncbi:UNVERIFIED_CONTAM: hypothetical protein K2H54_059800 [Gekko kuhli]
MAGLVVRLEEVEEKFKALAQCALALKEDLRVVSVCESPKVGEDQGSPQEVSFLASNDSNEASQHCKLPLSLHQLQTASSRAAAEAACLGSRRDEYLAILEGILKIQEALREILLNQDTLKDLVDGLLKAVTSMDARVHTIEQEMGLLSRFTEELSAVDTETNWG